MVRFLHFPHELRQVPTIRGESVQGPICVSTECASTRRVAEAFARQTAPHGPLLHCTRGSSSQLRLEALITHALRVWIAA